MKGPHLIYAALPRYLKWLLNISYRCQIQGINDQQTATIDMAAILPVTGETIIAVDAKRKYILLKDFMSEIVFGRDQVT